MSLESPIVFFKSKAHLHVESKKAHDELLCRTDTHRLCKNLWFPKGTVWGVGGCAGVVMEIL